MTNPLLLLLSPGWWLAVAPLRSLYGVIDRIEAEIVVVEWGDRSLSDVPASLFEGGAQEGRTACIRAWADSSGSWLAVGEVLTMPCVPEPCALPSPPFVEAGQRYTVLLRTPCVPPARFWVLRPS